MDSRLHSTVSCWAEIENSVCVCVHTHSNPSMVRLWQKQITGRLEGASGHDLVQLLFAQQNELGQVAQDQIQLGFEAESQCLNSSFLESWRVSLEVRHEVWKIFYLLGTFSNTFSGIKIHKCEICILRYLRLFIFLPRSQSEHLCSINPPPRLIVFLIVQKALVFLTPCTETLSHLWSSL